MEKHYQPRSKGTWGREEAKTAEELNRLCNEFFEKLEVPPDWKCMGWSNAVDPQLGLLSVGKIFRDKRTSGVDLMHYRVCFFTFSQRGGIVEKSIVDFGKHKYKSVDHGIFTIEKLNKYIADHYTLPPTHLVEELGEQKGILNDNSDGLQHFRDRFSNN